MKKIGTLLLMGIVLMMTVMAVSADLIWTPMDDYFMGSYAEESGRNCKLSRDNYYIAAGEHGYITAVDSPQNMEKTTAYPNGTVFYFTWTCEDQSGEWGALESVLVLGDENFSRTEGYVSLNDLVPAYDEKVFKSEHADGISANAEDVDICEMDGFTLWLAPGSGIPRARVSREMIEETCDPDSGARVFYGGSYQSESGIRWVKIQMYWTLEGWLCLDQAKTDKVN